MEQSAVDGLIETVFDEVGMDRRPEGHGWSVHVEGTPTELADEATRQLAEMGYPKLRVLAGGFRNASAGSSWVEPPAH